MTQDGDFGRAGPAAAPGPAGGARLVARRAGRAQLPEKPVDLSRIETGHRRIALDQLAPLARALGTTLDQLVESAAEDEDVVIRPHRDEERGITTWLLSREGAPAD